MGRVLIDSGVDWIKEIPHDWNITKISQKYTLRATKVSDKVYEPLSVTYGGVVPQLENVAKTDAHDARKLVKKDDFAINSRSDRRGACGIADRDGSVSLINIVLKPNDNMVAKYYEFLFHSIQFGDEFYKWGHGIVDDLWTTRWQDMKNISIPVPPLQEQQAIADYLDRKTAEIDAAITEAKSLIEKYKAYKQSIITEAVTKGLNPNVKKKGSGIEWIGEIPECWEVLPLLKVIWLRARLGWKGLKADEYVDEGYPFLSAFNIVSDKLNWEELNYITQDRYEESPEIKLSIGDVLIVKDGAGIGKSARIDSLPLGEATVNSSLGVITPYNKILYTYLHYFFVSNAFQNVIGFIKNGMGVPHLTQENMRLVRVTIPPLTEQKQIADYLDEKCSQIDPIISQKEHLVTQLQEYKKSIIFEYVTGKKEVPNAQ